MKGRYKIMRYYKYVNSRNENKYLEVMRYNCGHYAMKQYICARNSENKKNYTGAALNRVHIGTWHRVRKSLLVQILEDYKILYCKEV